MNEGPYTVLYNFLNTNYKALSRSLVYTVQ